MPVGGLLWLGPLLDREFSLLDETDLVFIDPVGTGYRRSAKPEDARSFHGLREEARSAGEFIRLYGTQNARWLSPKFLKSAVVP